MCNEKMLKKVRERREIMETIKQLISNWIQHYLYRECKLEDVIEYRKRGRRQRVENFDNIKKTKLHAKTKGKSNVRIYI